MDAMEIKSLDEHIFEHRNKAYGAYQLRKNQTRNLLIGMVAVYGSIALVWVASQVFASFFPEKPKEKIIDIFPADPEINQESWSEPKRPTQPGKSITQNSTSLINTFQIAENTVIDTANFFTSSQITGTETIDGMEDGTVNGKGTSDGDESSNTWVLGEEHVETPLIQVIEPASFPGGEQKLEEYIKTNFSFPEKESAGILVLSYEIDENGKTRNVKILKSFPEGGLFEQEAIRVLSNMPDWNPQKVNGKAVMVRREIRINCKL